MKGFAATSALVAGANLALAEETASPVAKVMELLAGLQAKIISEGETAQKDYDEYAEWCEDRNRNLDFEIKTGRSEVDGFKATIEEEVATAAALNTKIEELAASIASDEADLKSATGIRGKEASDFSAEEKELVEVIDTLGRAIRILSREMQKGGASMLQVKNAKNLSDALSAMVQASMLSQADHQQLTALIQSQQADAEEDDAAGAPAAAVYENQSGGVVDTLEDLQEKAQGQLDDARKKETAALHNFQMLKQSLEDSLKNAAKDSAGAKKDLADSAEKKASAEGGLDVTSKDLAEDIQTKATLHQGCLTKATDFEASTKSRAEELEALAKAKEVIAETTGAATENTYGLAQTSFLQRGSTQLSSTADLANFEVIRFVRDLARKQQSPALAQLASRIAAAMRVSDGSSDPFGKVKSMIADMIEKLESSGQADATHKAYCDKELSESKTKKGEQEYEIEKLSTKLDQMSSRSATLKEQVAVLQKALADLASSQAEMDGMRNKEHSSFVEASQETKQGLEGVKMALKVLRDYYSKGDKAHSSADGAATGIVGLLEVVESDFSKALAEMTSIEESAASTYEADTHENEIDKTMKSKDVEHKTAEAASLDKAVTEATADRANVQAELDAVNEYLGKLEDMCIAKAEPYEEIKRRREEEIAGLKEALKILDGEAVLLQSKRRALRGISRHA